MPTTVAKSAFELSSTWTLTHRLHLAGLITHPCCKHTQLQPARCRRCREALSSHGRRRRSHRAIGGGAVIAAADGAAAIVRPDAASLAQRRWRRRPPLTPPQKVRLQPPPAGPRRRQKSRPTRQKPAAAENGAPPGRSVVPTVCLWAVLERAGQWASARLVDSLLYC